jgi:hypothetical protein
MLSIRRNTPDLPEGSASDICEVHFVKAGHTYTFRYQQGCERHLIGALLDTALDPRLNLDLEDVRKLVGALGLGSSIQPASGA